MKIIKSLFNKIIYLNILLNALKTQYGFVNPNFFIYHKKSSKLTKILVAGKFKPCTSLADYNSRNCYYIYDTSLDECECPLYWIYKKCAHEVAVKILLKK